MIEDEHLTPEWQNIKLRSIDYRGRIIDEVTHLERMLDVYIASYFCESIDKAREFANIILGSSRISLDGKRKLFDTLIKLEHPDFFKINTDFNKDMNTVMYERNSFAHNMLYSGDVAIEQHETHVWLQKFNVKNREEWYDDEKVIGILNTIKKCRNIITKAAKPKWDALRPHDGE